MSFYINGIKRQNVNVEKLIKHPRKIQQDAIDVITNAIANQDRWLVNMPCRTGKTYTTLYSAYKAGVELVIVLCGKASAKPSYLTDSIWWSEDNNCVEGFEEVYTQNSVIKEALDSNLSSKDHILFEVTPQLLCHKDNIELQSKLKNLAQSKKTLFVFDEAHYYQQTENSQKMVEEIVGDNDKDILIESVEENFGKIPYVYLTASPDTQSLVKSFIDNGHYYELTKEEEWELYLEDLTRNVEDREFNYVPVRNCIFICDRILNSVFNTKTQQVVAYAELFGKLNKKNGQKFVTDSLSFSINTILNGPSKEFMGEDQTAPYSSRSSNINLMIKVPTQKKNNQGMIARILEYIDNAKESILTLYPQFTSIEILDATGTNGNCGQEAANKFLNEHTTSVNIILTKKRLIEGTTLHNLDGFLYWCNQTSITAMKQECGRTLTPVNNKRFGFIFFFDESALSLVRMLLQVKLKAKNKNNKAHRNILHEDDKKRLMRIMPTFLEADNGFKQLDYNDAIFTKTDLEKERVKETIFDKEALFSGETGERLKRLLLPFFGVASAVSSTREPKEKNANTSNSSTVTSARGSSKATMETPMEELKLEKLVTEFMKLYQNCTQLGIDCCDLNDNFKFKIRMTDIPLEAFDIMYSIEDVRDVMVNEIYFVTKRDSLQKNPELEELFND